MHVHSDIGRDLEILRRRMDHSFHHGFAGRWRFTSSKTLEETRRQLGRLDDLVATALSQQGTGRKPEEITFDPGSKTAVLLVNGYNGLGLHTLFNVIRLFGKEFRIFVFVEIGRY